MPMIEGFDKLASVPEEQITDKIVRRVDIRKAGNAGALENEAAAHHHPHEQFVWVMRGAIRLRVGAEERTIKPGDVAVIPGGVEHEALFQEDTEVIDFFALVREDFLTGEVPAYFAQR